MFESYLKPPISFPSVSGAVCSFDSQYAGLPLKSHSVAVTGYQSGSGTPSPSNPRALNGWSSANIAISDEDLYHDITVENGYLDIYGNVQASGVSSVTEYIPIVEGLVYYSYDYATAALDPRNICIYDDSKQFVSCITYETVNKKAYFTIPSTGAYIRITIDRNYIDQHLYNGTTATINFGSTIYGGNYDAVSGVLTVTHRIVDLGTLNWTYYSNVDAFYTNELQSTVRRNSGSVTASWIICPIYESSDINTMVGGADKAITVNTLGQVYIKDTAKGTDATALKNSLDGVYLSYELATPQTIQLPPCPIDTLNGVNNIWADTGDTTLQYIKLG